MSKFIAALLVIATTGYLLINILILVPFLLISLLSHWVSNILKWAAIKANDAGCCIFDSSGYGYIRRKAAEAVQANKEEVK